MVDLVDLVCVNTHVIAGLKIADISGSAGSASVFSRFRDGDSADGLVVGLNDDIVVPNSSQDPGERHLGLIPPAVRRRTSRSPLRIRPAWISTTRVSSAGSDNLAKIANTGQQEKGQ
jgi:hypothetical protein